jgi:hypothetical protein
MKRGFFDLLDPSNDPEFFWQVISGPSCILHAKVDGNYDYEISDISLWIPLVKPSLETEKILSSLLVSKSNFLCGWNALNCYRSNLWSSGSGNWRVVNNQNKISRVFIVFF